MALTNQDILNLIRTSTSQEYQSRIPTATKTNLEDVQNQIINYPTAKNEFIDVLTNQVSKTIFFSKLYENPFKFFRKGFLPYGKSIEAIFVDLIKGKAWNENFGQANTDVSSLISKQDWDNVKVEYYSENYRNKYKITVSEDQLRGAFRTPNGLSDLMSRLMQSPLNSAEFDEFLMVKKCLAEITMREITLSNFDTLTDDNQRAKLITRTIRTLMNKMRFLSDSYNTGGVRTFSKPSDLVILVTPETQALLDVELLATAFNMDKADVNARVVLIDEFLTKTEDGADTEVDENTIALICDKDVVQFYETENTSASFFNADRLETNVFFHRWGIMAGCSYVNAIKVKKPVVVSED